MTIKTVVLNKDGRQFIIGSLRVEADFFFVTLYTLQKPVIL